MPPDTPPDIRSRIAESFARQTLMQTFGASLGSVEAGRVTLHAPILPLARQQQGFGHAGLTFALADTAAGYAALTRAPKDHEVLTTEMKINLLAPAAGDALRAEGRVLKPGRRLIVVAADVFALNGTEEKLIATALGSIMPVGDDATRRT